MKIELATYALAAVLLIAGIVQLYRARKHKRAAWWNRSNEQYLRDLSFDQAKKRESDRGWNS